MNWFRVVTVVGIGLLGSVSTLVAGERGPSTPEERAQFVERVRVLEANPLAEGARETRQSLFEWLTEVPDIEAKVCADLLTKARDDKYPYAGEVTLHELLAAGSFAIQHPDKTKEDLAMYMAGVEGALRVYEAILKVKPESKWPPLGELVALRDHGDLISYVAKVAKKKCK